MIRTIGAEIAGGLQEILKISEGERQKEKAKKSRRDHGWVIGLGRGHGNCATSKLKQMLTDSLPDNQLKLLY